MLDQNLIEPVKSTQKKEDNPILRLRKFLKPRFSNTVLRTNEIQFDRFDEECPIYQPVTKTKSTEDLIQEIKPESYNVGSTVGSKCGKAKRRDFDDE